MPYSYFELLQGFFIVHSTICSTVLSRSMNSLEHCICATTMINIRPDRDSSLVPPGYKPQSIQMSHRGRQQNWTVTKMSFDKNPQWSSDLISPHDDAIPHNKWEGLTGTYMAFKSCSSIDISWSQRWNNLLKRNVTWILKLNISDLCSGDNISV